MVLTVLSRTSYNTSFIHSLTSRFRLASDRSDERLEHPVTAVSATTDQPRVITPVSHAFDNTTTPARAPPGKPTNTWCLPWYSGGDDNDECNATDCDGKEEGHSLALPPKTLVDENQSRVRTETTPMVVKSIKSGTGGDTFSSTTGDDLKPQSLLAQPRIRTLLFIEGIYSVCP